MFLLIYGEMGLFSHVEEQSALVFLGCGIGISLKFWCLESWDIVTRVLVMYVLRKPSPWRKS
jgi:hypothetical protein